MENEKLENQISVLNSLVEINNDRIEGYQTASDETTDPDLKRWFQALSHTSWECKEELESEILRLGGTPDQETTASGKLFRVWMDFKAAVTGKDRKAILSSCEQGEDVAVGAYEKALREESLEVLSQEQTRMVYAQYQLIKSEHDQIRELRDVLVDSE
jgi:uncharacterized protein (TIGR02284 family)